GAFVSFWICQDGIDWTLTFPGLMSFWNLLRFPKKLYSQFVFEGLNNDFSEFSLSGFTAASLANHSKVL
ncbi:MAG: hypothetical protein P1V97_31015, partial [Planctomycetota bacterium]|nr:hypothetical protein [Planctomycetota bacterium]